jgi:hypothetical protein
MKTGRLSFVVISEQGLERAPYPPMTQSEEIVLRAVAKGMCLSLSSLAWAWYEGKTGDGKEWQRLRERMRCAPVQLVKE